MRDVKAITCPAIIAIALVCISSLATAFELQVADANSKISCNAAQDPLPSWNDGYAKSAILNFVANVTNTNNPDYVVPEERIATFDNDGTLWCEYPDPVPFRFIIDRVKDMARDRPEWNNTEPFSSILSGKRFTMANFSDNEIMQIYVATSSNLTPEEYMSLTRDWLNRSKDPHFGLPYTKCVYKPMLELLSYLRTEGFKVYIVTGGDEDFVRAFSEEVYGIPPEQVIGSAIKLQFIANNTSSSVVKLPEILVWNDGQEKAEEIQQNIGRIPIFAYGNSDGDIPMLQFATGEDRPGIGLLNHHDDPIREYAYDNTIGALDNGLKMAGDWGWQVVSMKNDWNDIF
ncbi:MAG: haloacid dehalogenase-like hydrolase [Methanotrichaceae archaeon]|nr:haloacid dehalogenase-like hydrolase [Methanotrichaceae archaeon]